MTTQLIEPPPGALQRIRAFLRSDMRVLRWVFLGMYLALLGGCLWLFLSDGLWKGTAIIAGVFFGGQAMFILSSGTANLCRPIERRRLVLPVVVAAFMATVLLGGLVLALGELLYLGDSSPWWILFWWSLPGVWLVWGFVIWAYVQQWTRYRVLWGLPALLLGGSLAQLLATVPSHLIVRRRPGCLVGLATAIGIIAGIYVMLFSFGPMILALFLRPRLRRETSTFPPLCEHCGYDLRASVGRCPECGTPFSPKA